MGPAPGEKTGLPAWQPHALEILPNSSTVASYYTTAPGRKHQLARGLMSHTRRPVVAHAAAVVRFLPLPQRCRVRGCGSRARTSRLVATPGMRAAPPVRPSTREMLTISRPPPRRCSAACLLGSATRRFCIFFAYRWLPRDHAPCVCFVSLGVHVRVFLALPQSRPKAGRPKPKLQALGLTPTPRPCGAARGSGGQWRPPTASRGAWS